MKTYVTILILASAAAACDKTTPTDTTHITSAKVNAGNLDNSSAPNHLVQGTSAADVEATQAVRAAIGGDDALSTQAKDVDVFTNDGVVVLHGAVKTEGERQALENKAREVGAPRAASSRRFEIMMLRERAPRRAGRGAHARRRRRAALARAEGVADSGALDLAAFGSTFPSVSLPAGTAVAAGPSPRRSPVSDAAHRAWASIPCAGRGSSARATSRRA